MKVSTGGDTVRISGITDFYPEHVFDCGQAFRWNRDGDGYVGVVQDRVLRVTYCAGSSALILEHCDSDWYDRYMRHYLGLDRDYGRIREELSADPVLKEAVRYGWGMRVLNQDPWETLISFILSANNNIKRIKGIIGKLSEKYGREIHWDGRTYYTFPTPAALSRAGEESLRACGCGYRGPYIAKTARMVSEGQISLSGIRDLSYPEAHKALLACAGVGDKVADCVLLYSMEKSEAFPIDVWVKRVMEYYYIGRKGTARQVRSFAAEKFGKLSGVAQQYLFYYAREQKIGKPDKGTVRLPSSGKSFGRSGDPQERAILP